MMVKVKRERLTTSEVENESEASIDRISLLPKEVLGLILSFLTLKEAAATSILCLSWKYLWTLTPNLNLKGSLAKVKTSTDDQSASTTLIEERRNYISWVDRVIASHPNLDLEEFRIWFDLDASHTKCIDEWLRYALSRKTQRLKLNLIDYTGFRTFRNHDLCYNFPYQKGNLPDNFKLLKELFMCHVNVTGKTVQFFLGNCPLLERVSVSHSQVMSSLKIIQTFPSFKCLEISLCINLKSVVVRDSNVVNIKYRGERIRNFVLVNVPLLTQLWIGGIITKRMRDVAKMFSSVLPQLEIFKIYFFSSGLSQKESKEFASAVEMNNLKQMVVCLYNHNDKDSLLPLINLITAAPCLQRFVLEAPHEPSDEHNNLLDGARAINRETLKMIPRAYLHLKEIEFVGYHGLSRQFELMMHFVDNNVALKNIVVDPRCLRHRLVECPWEHMFRHKMDDHEIFARDYAKEQLEKHVPPIINWKIL